MEHENDIDDLFQKSFENFEVLPPDELKKKIDEQLNFKEKKRRFFGLPSVLPLAVWLFGGISLIGGVILAILLLYTPGNKNHDNLLGKTAEANEELRPPQAAAQLIENEEEKEKAQLLKTQRQRRDKEKGKLNDTSDNKTKKNTLNVNSASEKENTDNNQQAAGEVQNKETSAHSSDSGQNDIKASSKKNKGTNKKQQKNRKKGKGKKDRFPFVTNENDPQNNTVDVGEKNSKQDEQDPEQDRGDQEKEQSVADSADSLVKAKEAAALAKKDDSSENDSLADNYENPDRKKPEPQPLSPFLVGVQFGLTKAINRSDETVTFGESNPLYINFDASYRRRKVGASTGFNYFSTGESVSQSYTSLDTTLYITYDYITEDSMEYIFDTNQIIIDSIVHTYVVDSTAVENYDITTNSHTQTSVYRVSYFSIPFMLSYQQRLFSKFYLDLMAGGVISYQKLRFTGDNPANSNVTLSELGFRLCVKTNLRYQFSKFGVSLNSNFNYDLKPVQYLQTSRKRQALDFGVGIWYNF